MRLRLYVELALVVVAFLFVCAIAAALVVGGWAMWAFVLLFLYNTLAS